MLQTGARATVREAGRLLGFVSSGGYSRLHGSAIAIAFCAAEALLSQLHGAANVSAAVDRQQLSTRGPVLVLVRRPSSRQFRPALATVAVL